ncbi:hypothetical protein SCHIN_v1c07620 [Spiroplasma chinense]|uniref:Uncharacterized protein n=1 Tax=Spiroplasma chinense TaxID=216932 RepID=A0A5B9Y6S0_9MOLU|nr:hypothetical protein [Spiroplasma chinense]QEH61957.1 hypothetical protein SCHIN_v1c07620 [Spiroplasma chinense]
MRITEKWIKKDIIDPPFSIEECSLFLGDVGGVNDTEKILNNIIDIINIKKTETVELYCIKSSSSSFKFYILTGNFKVESQGNGMNIGYDGGGPKRFARFLSNLFDIDKEKILSDLKENLSDNYSLYFKFSD